jgi:hypothetical protein
MDRLLLVTLLTMLGHAGGMRTETQAAGGLGARGRAVFPGEVKVVAAPVAGIAVVADPAEGRSRVVLGRFGPAGERGGSRLGGALRAQRTRSGSPDFSADLCQVPLALYDYVAWLVSSTASTSSSEESA